LSDALAEERRREVVPDMKKDDGLIWGYFENL
jgi:hypothetical protein